MVYLPSPAGLGMVVVVAAPPKERRGIRALYGIGGDIDNKHPCQCFFERPFVGQY
jgi:hypothetical protein